MGCFGTTKIEPMDFDGVVERFRHFLVFETKGIGKEIPKGQLITFEGLKNPKDFCVMKIWGKNKPEYFESSFFYKGKLIEEKGRGLEEAKNFIKRWFNWASKN